MCMCENANAIKYLQFSDFSRKGIPNLTSGESEFRTFSEKSDLSLALHLVYWGWKHIYNCHDLDSDSFHSKPEVNEPTEFKLGVESWWATQDHF